MMRFKEFIVEQTVRLLEKRDVSELKAQLSVIEDKLGETSGGRKKARLCNTRNQLQEALTRKTTTDASKSGIGS